MTLPPDSIISPNHVNVCDYGADPTGEQDSTDAIRTVAQVARDRGDGAAVYFPAGSYTFRPEAEFDLRNGRAVGCTFEVKKP